MNESRFTIIFDGQLMPETRLEAVKDNLVRLFKRDRARIDALFSGAPTVIKRNLPESQADQYLKALHAAGIRVRKEREGPGPAQAAPVARPPQPGASRTYDYAELDPFTLQGRIGRLRYLAWSLMLLATTLALLGLAFIGYEFSNRVGVILMASVAIAMAVLGLMISVQRLHDIGWSGWLLLLPGVALALPFVRGSRGANRFGPPPPPNSTAVRILGLLWLAVPPLGLLATIAVPAYQEYLNRTGL